MLTIQAIFILALAVLVLGDDINDDLARGLVCNDSVVIKLVNSDGRLFSKQPEDCAGVSLYAKATQQHAPTGIYEIWPRQGKC